MCNAILIYIVCIKRLFIWRWLIARCHRTLDNKTKRYVLTLSLRCVSAAKEGKTPAHVKRFNSIRDSQTVSVLMKNKNDWMYVRESNKLSCYLSQMGSYFLTQVIWRTSRLLHTSWIGRWCRWTSFVVNCRLSFRHFDACCTDEEEINVYNEGFYVNTKSDEFIALEDLFGGDSFIFQCWFSMFFPAEVLNQNWFRSI